MNVNVEIDWPQGPGGAIDLVGVLHAIEVDLIKRALALSNGKTGAAAKLLGLKRTTLGMKLRKLRLEAGK